MRTDLKNIAENLVNMSAEQIEDVTQMLEDEYGVIPMTEENKAKEEARQRVILGKANPRASMLMPTPRIEKHSKDWYAPRKIGKPCTKGKFYRR